MARIVKQTLPQPPPHYDQAFIAQLVKAVNQYMVQREAEGEVIAGRFIMTDPVAVDDKGTTVQPGHYPDTKQLPTGTIYGRTLQTVAPSDYVLCVVRKTDV